MRTGKDGGNDRARAVSRNVHISAPHPRFDVGTPAQAAYIFKATGSKSLLIAGRTPTAFLNLSPCISTASLSAPIKSTVHPKFHTCSHYLLVVSQREPFFDASLAIYAWQQRRGCPLSMCAYIQMHGNRSSTCPLDQIFLSAGLGRSSTAKAWYIDCDGRPMKRLRGHLQLAFPLWNVSLPPNSSCALTATRNVVGRYINGVDEHSVCHTGADPPAVSGEFIHVEQDDTFRWAESYKMWAAAVRKTFVVTCADEMSVDPDTGLCLFSRPREPAGDPVFDFVPRFEPECPCVMAFVDSPV
ncbi:hypothetical protein K443DRAFT_626384 [Laccaria amethystina LaAM-08-1]|uniref:Unplaced genomic scaffold K443scaffold_125, whole genome shotgun sequence n=1 Tax=Laccaria amethystina LaAM-08-1 TaxID=1095629 RepID=A0A0C9X132_9AGAR|nr:hypothetical protein K443DRAFT_626384 [Laccaria amethystina LaAM-08-1]